MLYREIIAVCSQIHRKHINTLCGQNVGLSNVVLMVQIVTTGLSWLNVRVLHLLLDTKTSVMTVAFGVVSCWQRLEGKRNANQGFYIHLLIGHHKYRLY